jgi:2-dehydro-3-deoxyphosphooctonate aldolase (KDO 8-P synthase)
MSREKTSQKSLIDRVSVVDVAGVPCGAAQLFLIAGPCVIENYDLMAETADTLKGIASRLDMPLIFKSSFQKDNRSTGENFRGPGLESGLETLARVRADFELPVTSDIHMPSQVPSASEVLDLLQIPAFLCMQTDLVEEAAKTGLPVNIKHGQFLAPGNMALPVEKVRRLGNEKVMVAERGFTFGYDDLVVDPRSFYLMRQIGVPVIFDITHSVRRYGIPSADPRGGHREYLGVLARAAVGAGVDGLFLEVHPNPEEALCDAASQIYLADLEEYLKPLIELNAIVKGL